MHATQVALVTEPGDPGRPNEDFAAVATPSAGTAGALVVLDGVTPPAGDDGCRHGVPWFVTRLGSELLSAATASKATALAECLVQAIDRTAQAHRHTCDLSHPRTPQATAVVCRWDEHRVDHLVLCDATLLVATAGGGVVPVLDTALDGARAVARSAPHGQRAARLESLRNAPGGFHTAAADPAAAGHAVTGSRPRAEVAGLAAFTDGVGRWSEVFRLGDWSALHALLTTDGPAAAVAAVRAAERGDPDGAAHPRGKRHDDATAVVVALPAVAAEHRGATGD
ncbi:protein phosphatase 2C domain-containing protein [Streptomyces bohaiensis]|uniref:protein phosphatase 2C domain-containing protein n=1 Tax=Streptomyces bohaiensis TaxID=1431344 RepID=UPI003B813040